MLDFMQVAVFSTKPYDRTYLNEANGDQHELHFFEPRLSLQTAPLAAGFPALCAFVNDDLGGATLEKLAAQGLKVIALRCAGFNNVDLKAVTRLGLTVVRVPAYSPYAVAEHTLALILGLNRQLPRAYNRVREGNFSLDGLLGFDLHGRTVGLFGTGKIGRIFARILTGFGVEIIGYDPAPHPEFTELGGHYVSLPELYQRSDILSLHCPLTPQTRHVIAAPTIAQMKKGVMLINTSRGALIDTAAVIQGLKSAHIGYLGLDVYEEESELFFEDLSGQILQDDLFTRLLTFPNVLITGHQAFFTREALRNIAQTTIDNLTGYEKNQACPNKVSL
jgi:D-lactate dehydrogenase